MIASLPIAAVSFFQIELTNAPLLAAAAFIPACILAAAVMLDKRGKLFWHKPQGSDSRQSPNLTRPYFLAAATTGWSLGLLHTVAKLVETGSIAVLPFAILLGVLAASLAVVSTAVVSLVRAAKRVP